MLRSSRHVAREIAHVAPAPPLCAERRCGAAPTSIDNPLTVKGLLLPASAAARLRSQVDNGREAVDMPVKDSLKAARGNSIIQPSTEAIIAETVGVPLVVRRCALTNFGRLKPLLTIF